MSGIRLEGLKETTKLLSLVIRVPRIQAWSVTAALTCPWVLEASCCENMQLDA
jgi:hypothetical protein